MRGVSTWLTVTLNGRLAGFFYTEEGKVATKQIWEETMKELKFAHVEEIIASLKG